MRVDTKQATAVIVNEIDRVLKPEGYRLSGQTFRWYNNETVSVLQLQRSSRVNHVASGSLVPIFTVNLGVFSRELQKRLGQWNAKPHLTRCHWSERIGHLLPDDKDRWWWVRDADQAVQAGRELAELVKARCVPLLQRLSTTAGLHAYWSAGSSGLISAATRREYLEILNGQLQSVGARPGGHPAAASGGIVIGGRW